MQVVCLVSGRARMPHALPATGLSFRLVLS